MTPTKPIRKVTGAWLASDDRWKTLLPTSGESSTDGLTPVQRAILTALVALAGQAHITELAERLECTEQFALQQARFLRDYVRIRKDLDTYGTPLMAVLIKPYAPDA